MFKIKMKNAIRLVLESIGAQVLILLNWIFNNMRPLLPFLGLLLGTYGKSTSVQEDTLYLLILSVLLALHDKYKYYKVEGIPTYALRFTERSDTGEVFYNKNAVDEAMRYLCEVEEELQRRGASYK